MKTLEKLEMLNIKTTNKYSVISIVNWVEYQQSEQQMNNKRTTNEQQMNTNKNVKNVKNEKNEDKKKSPKVAPSDRDFENAHLLFDLMQGNIESAKAPNFENWAHTFRKLRNDYPDHTDKFLKYVIQYSQERSYRKSNIRSADTFRKHYESLYIDAREEVKKQKVIPITKNNQHDFEGLKEKLRNEQQQNRIT